MSKQKIATKTQDTAAEHKDIFSELYQLRWEFVRRNSEYRADYERFSKLPDNMKDPNFHWDPCEPPLPEDAKGGKYWGRVRRSLFEKHGNPMDTFFAPIVLKNWEIETFQRRWGYFPTSPDQKESPSLKGSPTTITVLQPEIHPSVLPIYLHQDAFPRTIEAVDSDDVLHLAVRMDVPLRRIMPVLNREIEKRKRDRKMQGKKDRWMPKKRDVDYLWYCLRVWEEYQRQNKEHAQGAQRKPTSGTVAERIEANKHPTVLRKIERAYKDVKYYVAEGWKGLL